MTLSQVTVYANIITKSMIGYQAISLTNYDNELEPQIAAGSKVEIGSALFEAVSNENISGWAGISNSSDVYIKLVVSGATATAEFTTDAPTWSMSKQGFYDGSDRYIAQLYKDASGNYSYKYVFGGLSAGGNRIEDVGLPFPSVVKLLPGTLWCDGSTISNISNPEYSRLIYLLKKEAGADTGHSYYHADSDKAVLPDLRGAVVRGIDAAANRDHDGARKSGAYQADELKTHKHQVRRKTGADSSAGLGHDTYCAVTWDDSHVANAGTCIENTMKNVALYYLVKY